MISERFRVLQNLRRRDDLALYGLCVAFGLLIFWQYDLLHAPIKHDMTLQMYAAQIIAEGLPPYVSVGLVKTPLTPMYGALALKLGNVFGVWDILAVRIAFWLVMALGAGGLYLWAERQFKSRAAGLVAVFAFVGFDLIGKNAVAGPQPKTLMLVSAIYCLLFLQRGRWLWAGVCASLAFLAWQPAAVLIALALFTPLADPIKNRWREFLHGAVGVALPILLVLIYLLFEHALVAAIGDTFGANLAYLQNSSEKTPLRETIVFNALHLGERLVLVCYPERWVTVTGLLGTLGLLALYLREGILRKHWHALVARTRMPLTIYAGVFLGFTLVDFQVCDDTMPFALVLAFGAAAAFAAARTWVGQHGASLRRLEARYLWIPAVAIFLLPTANAFNDRSSKLITLDYQVAIAAQVAPYLSPDDQIQQLGDASLLIFLHRHNTTKLIFFGPKTGSGVLQFIPGGIQGVIDQLDARPPKVVALSHMEWRSNWKELFFKWLDAHYIRQGEYRMFPTQNLIVYVRKD